MGGSGGGAEGMTVEAGEEIVEVLAGEGPMEGTGGELVVVLKGEQVVFEVIKGAEFIRRKHLALDNGEIDLDLVEPAGMDRGVNQHDGGPRLAQAVGCFEATVR